MQTIRQAKNRTTTERPGSSSHRFGRAIVAGVVAGLASGIIVLIPVLILQSARGVGVVPAMQLAASSVMGMAAYAGAIGLFVGTLLHFFVSVVPAVAYALIAWLFPVVNRLPWIGGPVLGLIVFFFMGLVVLPLSIFTTPASISPMPFVPALLIHMFGLGLPIALIIRSGRLRP